MQRVNNKPTISKTSIVVALVVVLLAAGGAFAYYHFSDTSVAPQNSSGIDLSPATEPEKQDSNERKEETAQQEDTPPPAPGATSVTPIIVDASQYSDQIEVRSYVPAIYEDGGTCTVTFSKGSLTFTKQSAANKGATTTSCANVNVTRSEFAEAGQWTAVVSYSSPTALGNSQPKTFEVQ